MRKKKKILIYKRKGANMKKFLIHISFLLAIPLIFPLISPAQAACPIEGGETVCSLPGFRERVSPVYNPSGDNISEFSDSPEARLKPVDRSDIREQAQSFAPTENDFNYNSSCQFGVCLQNRSKPLFQQGK